MHLYYSLSKVSFLRKSYPKKFLFVAFLGIHIPLIGLIAIIIFAKEQFSHLTVILFTLLMTLLATLITLFVIRKLIKPIDMASKALIGYKNKRTLPDLPLHHEDEAGLLLSNIQSTIDENERYLNQKQDLVYLLTHDIKNFVFPQKALAEFIIDEGDDVGLRKQYANLIIESSNKQIEFLEAFITLIHEEDEIVKTAISKTTIGMKQVVQTIENGIAVKLKEKNIRFKVHCEMDKVILNINEILFTRVLFNLLFNAIKFSYTESEIVLDIKQSGQFLNVQVQDFGMGFDFAKKELLFAKFTSMGRVGTSNETSTGIGLYLCDQIVQKFKGTIDAFSEGKDKGAIFTVKFKILE